MSQQKGWRDKDFRPASCRGVKFTAQVVEHVGGRPVVGGQAEPADHEGPP